MIRFYFDDDSGMRSVIRALQDLGIEATRTIESGTAGWTDLQHLDFAAKNGLTIVTSNSRDFLRLHTQRVASGQHHAGVVIADQRMGIGVRIERLRRLAETLDASTMRDRIEFLSHWGDEPR